MACNLAANEERKISARNYRKRNNSSFSASISTTSLAYSSLHEISSLKFHLLAALVRKFCHSLDSIDRLPHTKIHLETKAIKHPGCLPDEMNSTTRDNIFANKERLHQLTQATRGESSGEIGMQQIIKEKARQAARELEERRYLRQHNKTVTRVLSQAAKATDPTRLSSEDEEEEEESEEDSDADDQLEQPQKQKEKARVSGENRMGEKEARMDNDDNQGRSLNKGKREDLVSPFRLVPFPLRIRNPREEGFGRRVRRKGEVPIRTLTKDAASSAPRCSFERSKIPRVEL